MLIELDIKLLYEALTVVLVLVVTYIIGRITARILRETFKKARIPETETATVASIVKYSIYLTGIFIALGYIGIPVIYFLIALGLVAAVLGIAARSALDSILSGYFLRLYGPFDIGDVIEIEGRTGSVKDLTMLKTILESPEHLVYSIPNSKVIQSEIYNFTKYKSDHPVELDFEISKEADLENVKLEILDIVNSYPRVNYEKPVKIHVQHFTERGVLLKIMFFVTNFEIKQGARDFVASEILKKSKMGKIPLLYSPSRNVQQNPLTKIENMNSKSPVEGEK